MENVELVTFMREHDGVTPEDASAQLGVSTRTLRKYVARANESLSGSAVVELIRGEGYRLRVLDQEGWTPGSPHRMAAMHALRARPPRSA